MRCLATGLALGVLLSVGVAMAAPAVRWEAPAGCPDREAVERVIAAWLGQPPEALDLGSVIVDARVRRQDRQWVLRVSVRSPTGSDRQELTAAMCDALVNVVALKVSLAVDPLGTAQSVEPVDAPAERPPQRSKPERAARPLVAEAVPSPRVAVRVAGGAGLGQLSAVTPSIGAWLSVEPSWFRVELGSAYWFRREERFAVLPSVGARFDLWTGVVRVCPIAHIGEVAVPVCAGFEVGVLRATGFGATEVRTVYEPWVAAVIGPAVSLPLTGSLRLWVETDAILAIERPGFAVRNVGRLHQADRAAVQAWGGFEFEFD